MGFERSEAPRFGEAGRGWNAASRNAKTAKPQGLGRLGGGRAQRHATQNPRSAERARWTTTGLCKRPLGSPQRGCSEPEPEPEPEPESESESESEPEPEPESETQPEPEPESESESESEPEPEPEPQPEPLLRFGARLGSVGLALGAGFASSGTLLFPARF